MEFLYNEVIRFSHDCLYGVCVLLKMVLFCGLLVINLFVSLTYDGPEILLASYFVDAVKLIWNCNFRRSNCIGNLVIREFYIFVLLMYC